MKTRAIHGRRLAAFGILTAALILILTWNADAKAATYQQDRLWLPIHLDRQMDSLDPDWVYTHYPTVSIGGVDQIFYDGRHRSVYIKLTRTSRTGLPETAYSHDADGRRVRDKARPGLLVGNPSSLAWQDHVHQLCREAIVGLDSDSCFGDGVGLASYYRMVTRPVAADGHELTRSEWVDRLVRMLESFPPELRVVANTAGWESPQVAAAAWARSVEGNPNTPREYELTMQDSRAWILAYTDGPTRLARFLLYAGPEDRFAYWARDRAHPVAYLRQYTMPIGTPRTTTPGATGAGVVYRQYTNGLAIWNPTADSRTVDLQAQYRTVNGTTVRTVTLRPGDAYIYTLAP